MKTAQSGPNRNDPCPCGSGRKFKHCCIGKTLETPAKRSNRTVKVLLIAAAVGILAVVMMFSYGRRTGNQSAVPQGGGTPEVLPATATPAPWQYDAVNNRHWDPNHGHWHDGPAPSQTGLLQGSGTRPATPQATTPAPWEYDTVRNRHWHPDHGHWHDGPPPSQTALPQGSATRQTPSPPEE